MNDQIEESGIYYYHADHLGSSSVVTDKNGKFHEHLESFPYGETWINDRANNENLPYRFTGKELDPETGLYYYGARYYDARLSRWISADPILKDYLPKNDFFRKNDKHIEKYFNSVYKRKPEKEDVQSFTAQKYFVLSYDIIDIKELKGIGGVYNVINLNLYTYCANNPVRVVDPDGKWILATESASEYMNKYKIAPTGANYVIKVRSFDGIEHSGGSHDPGYGEHIVTKLQLIKSNGSNLDSKAMVEFEQSTLGEIYDNIYINEADMKVNKDKIDENKIIIQGRVVGFVTDNSEKNKISQMTEYEFVTKAAKDFGVGDN